MIRSVLRVCALLAAVYAIVGAAAALGFGQPVGSIVLAAVACWVGFAAAIWLALVTSNTPKAIGGTLGGILVELVFPLILGGMSSLPAVAGRFPGLFGWAAACFLLGLMVKTLLLVSMLDRKPAATGAAVGGSAQQGAC